MAIPLSAIERMTPAERAAFGEAEAKARRDDLALVHSGTLSLAAAQERAQNRRKPWGLTANQATALMRK